jgi:transcriptional regulator with XRE-family HTH domain
MTDEVTNTVVEVGEVHELGAFLHRLRKEVGLTLVQVAEYVGITYNALSMIENGHHYPRFKTLLTIGEACGVDLWLTAEVPAFDNEALEASAKASQALHESLGGLDV